MDIHQGQLVTLPGFMATQVNLDLKEIGRVYIPFDMVEQILTQKENGLTIINLRGNRGQLYVKESVDNLLSPSENAKYAVEFGGAFMQGMTEKLKFLKKLMTGI